MAPSGGPIIDDTTSLFRETDGDPKYEGGKKLYIWTFGYVAKVGIRWRSGKHRNLGCVLLGIDRGFSLQEEVIRPVFSDLIISHDRPCAKVNMGV